MLLPQSLHRRIMANSMTLSGLTVFRQTFCPWIPSRANPCLSCIADFGINFGDFQLKSTVPTMLHGDIDDLLKQIPSSLSMDFSAFYIPHNPQFEDIDALYFQYKHQSKAATVIQIQITISKHHTDSEWFFYKNWNNWKTRLSNYT